jgi:DNA-3-methyladenine glycosylase I
MLEYHDQEWGVPVHDDRGHFEHLILDTFQAGLSWAIIMKKRKAFRRAFRNFDPQKVAKFSPADVERLILDPSIIRNRKKIEAAVDNASPSSTVGMVNSFIINKTMLKSSLQIGIYF